MTINKKKLSLKNFNCHHRSIINKNLLSNIYENIHTRQYFDPLSMPLTILEAIVESKNIRKKVVMPSEAKSNKKLNKNQSRHRSIFGYCSSNLLHDSYTSFSSFCFFFKCLIVNKKISNKIV